MMKVQSNHLLKEAIYLPSPHYNERPAHSVVDTIVIHNISLPPGQFGTGAVHRFFCDTLDCNEHPDFLSIKDLKVSSHLFIDREGIITQFVPFHLRAWHAGVSSFNGKDNCNDFSIGIELEGTDHLAFEKKQYEQLAKVVRALMESYPNIKKENIIGHSDIAPGRKTDPGPAFEWDTFHCLLESLSA